MAKLKLTYFDNHKAANLRPFRGISPHKVRHRYGGRSRWAIHLTRLPLWSWNDAAILGLLMHVNDELAGWRTIIVLPIVFLLPGSDGDSTVVGLGAGRRSIWPAPLFWRRLTLRLPAIHQTFVPSMISPRQALSLP